MSIIWLVAILFGLIHPASKLILETGIGLTTFLLAFFIIRLAIAMGYKWMRGGQRSLSPLPLPYLLLLGLSGAIIHFFEFKAIALGTDPHLVTTIMFAYPVWLVLWNIFSPSQCTAKTRQILIGLLFSLGLLTSTWPYLIQGQSWQLSYPMLAGLGICLWIFLANKLRSMGHSSLDISIYFDAASLMILFSLLWPQLRSEWGSFVDWIDTRNTLWLVLFSLGCGLIPNLLMYHASAKISASTIAYVVSLEPIFATAFTLLFFSGIHLNIHTLLGMALILAAHFTRIGLPLQWHKWKYPIKRFYNPKGEFS
ncbi:MAG: DMT family transporter [Pseudobacteriovorax sp.]|nr:DMT family transporter [Pseudobacteriovorax sp.]